MNHVIQHISSMCGALGSILTQKYVRKRERKRKVQCCQMIHIPNPSLLWENKMNDSRSWTEICTFMSINWIEKKGLTEYIPKILCFTTGESVPGCLGNRAWDEGCQRFIKRKGEGHKKSLASGGHPRVKGAQKSSGLALQSAGETLKRLCGPWSCLWISVQVAGKGSEQLRLTSAIDDMGCREEKVTRNLHFPSTGLHT